jgi:hypothetical protein
MDNLGPGQGGGGVMAKHKELKPRSTAEERIEDFLGLNILDRPESCKPGELQKAMNVDIDRNLDIRRRKGYARIYSGNVHSLWCDKGPVLFREDSYLRTLNTDYSATTLLSGLQSNRKMCFERIFDKIYFSDGMVTGITDGRSAWGWGVEPPPQPQLARAAGLMPPGVYLCTLTYMKVDGQESGSPLSLSITLPTRSGVALGGIVPSADPLVSSVNIYLSTANGETLYRAMSVPNGTVSTSYGGDTKAFNLPLRTQLLNPPLPGHIIKYYNGRIYVASDDILTYTEPYAYELTNLAHNYIPQDGRITLLAPVRDGIWVSTKKETYFWQVDDPNKPNKRIVKTIWGAIEGTQAIIDLSQGDEKIWGWMWLATDGIHLGLDGGNIKNYTWSKWMPPEANWGTALLREEMGLNQFLVAVKKI